MMQALPAIEQDFFSAVLDQPNLQFPSDSEVDDILNSLVKEDPSFETTLTNTTSTWIPQPVSFPPSISPLAATIVPTSPEQHSSISGSPAMSPSTSAQNDDDDDDEDEDDNGKKKRKRDAKKVELEFIGLTAENVAVMPSKDFEDYVKMKQATMTFTKEQLKHIKWVRRKILNREYAVQCRKKKAGKWQDLEVRVKELEQENTALKQQVAHLMSENQQLRSSSSSSSSSRGLFSGIGGRNASAACLLVLLFSFGVWFALPNTQNSFAYSSSSSSSSSYSSNTGRLLLDAEASSVSNWWLRLLYGTRALEQKQKIPPPPTTTTADQIPQVEDLHQDELQCLTRAELDRLVSVRVQEQIAELKTTNAASNDKNLDPRAREL